MKIYTNLLSFADLTISLLNEIHNGKIGDDVNFDKLNKCGSRKRLHAFDVHLISYTKEPGSKRHRPNNGVTGYDGSEVWAATYDEWGWFIAELYRRDPDALIGQYKSQDHFHTVTHGAYLTDQKEN